MGAARSGRHWLLAAAATCALIGSLSPTRAGEDADLAPPAAAISSAATALDGGNLAGAHDAAATVLSHNPRDGRLQFLNGLAYHLASERGEATAADLARVGYESSLRVDPNDYWPNYMLGTLEFERGDWKQSQQHFSEAILRRPDDWRAMAGLASASYYAGDAQFAALTGERAARLAPNEPLAQRVAALASEAAGDDASARRYLAAYTAAGGTPALATRLDGLKRTAAVDYGYPAPAAANPPAPEPAAPTAAAQADASPPPNNQMLVDVTIILSDDTTIHDRGVNLLDGLTLQFGYDDTRVAASGAPASKSVINTVTEKITVPTITYNLNILNNQKQFYWVLARPTLTAYVGEQSTFFVGHTLHVAVSGINLGSLEQVDAGVSLKLSPLSISGNHVKFHIDADRSFLDPVPLQGFPAQISIFKEQASATAELDYGQTLILSGMQENVYDADNSTTPGLADVPVLGEFFGRKQLQEQKTSVLILVTPVPPIALTLPNRLSRDGATERVIDLWSSVIDPETDTGFITERLKNWRLYTRAEEGDIKVAGPDDSALLHEALADTSSSAP